MAIPQATLTLPASSGLYAKVSPAYTAMYQTIDTLQFSVTFGNFLLFFPITVVSEKRTVAWLAQLGVCGAAEQEVEGSKPQTEPTLRVLK